MSKCRHAAGGRSLRLGGLTSAYQVVESLGLPKAGISLSGESTQEFCPLSRAAPPLREKAATRTAEMLEKVPTSYAAAHAEKG